MSRSLLLLISLLFGYQNNIRCIHDELSYNTKTAILCSFSRFRMVENEFIECFRGSFSNNMQSWMLVSRVLWLQGKHPHAMRSNPTSAPSLWTHLLPYHRSFKFNNEHLSFVKLVLHCLNDLGFLGNQLKHCSVKRLGFLSVRPLLKTQKLLTCLNPALLFIWT